jgi:diguanylate cyclase (GGDEF)-like protein
MTVRFQQLLAWLRRIVSENSEVQGEASLDSLRRFRVAALAFFPVNVAYMLEFWFNTGADESLVRLRWADAVGWAHLVMAVSVAAVGWLIHRYCVAPRSDHRYAMVLHVVFVGVCLLFGVALSVIDQWVTASTTNFVMLCLLTAMVSLLRPEITVVLYAVAYALLYLLLGFTQADPHALALARSQSLGAVLTSVVASTMVWRQYVISVLLRREIVISNQALTRQQTELAFLATHDSLTGLLVRREFMRLAQMELARAARFGHDTGLLMVDLDFFKRINDQYGHPAGDEVLQQVAAMLTAGVRTTDVVARLGGEEFIVLMPNTSVEGALAVAEKLRTSVHKEALNVFGRLVPVTASLGVSAQVHQQPVSVDKLYGAADRALYVAKKSGRDRVEYAAAM